MMMVTAGFLKVKKGRVVTIQYSLFSEHGALLERSTQEHPLTYLHGYGNIVSGLEDTLDGKKAGFTTKAIVVPEQGYGNRDDDLVFDVPRENFPPEVPLDSGLQVAAEGEHGSLLSTVVSVTDELVTLDANHPLAGITLHFDVEVIDVREATQDEMAKGRLH